MILGYDTIICIGAAYLLSKEGDLVDIYMHTSSNYDWGLFFFFLRRVFSFLLTSMSES